MICAVIKGPSLAAISRQLTAVLSSANLVELRLDLFEKIEKNDLKLLLDNYSLPLIFTLRSVQQGGAFQGSEADYLKTLRFFLDLNPKYLDLESHLPTDVFEEIQSHYPEIKLICSYHHFRDTPEDLDTLYKELQQKSAFFYKMAVMAKDSLDALRLMVWAKKQDRKLIAISMGPFGQISRILAPVLGCPFTYASVDQEKENVLGQLSTQTLVDIYHYPSLNLHTKIYGLIGEIVDRSVSHETHNALIRAMNLDAVYIKLSVKSTELDSFLNLAKQLPFSGLSVTMPLKEMVMKCIDEIDQEAKSIGSVNTLVFKGNEIKGFNTDGIGALESIERLFSIKNKKVIMIGAGGAAKAIAYEACRRGAHVAILNRDSEKANRLAKELKCEGEALSLLDDSFSPCDLLINCTPLTMPIPLKYLSFCRAVMDINTKPKDTELLKEAKQKGCLVIYGYTMFIEQAVRQFDLWFNHTLDPSQSREILNQKILTLLS